MITNTTIDNIEANIASIREVALAILTAEPNEFLDNKEEWASILNDRTNDISIELQG